MTSRDLMGAGLFVRRSMEMDKLAAKPSSAGAILAQGAGEIVKGVGRGVKGLGSVVGAGTKSMGAEASKQMGGGAAGGLAEYGIRAAPWIAGAGAVNYGLGNPVGQVGSQALANYRARMQQQQGAWDPNSGMMV